MQPENSSFHQPLPEPERTYKAFPTTMWGRLFRRVVGDILEWSFRGLSGMGRLSPAAWPSRYGLEVLRDIPYGPTQESHHRLDVYRPKQRDTLLPAVLYIHGGGFRILSKETHWMMGINFSRENYVTFNINYRLAPKHPYPAAAQDCVDALLWVMKHAEEYGADPNRIILAGESAGGNLVTMLTVASHYNNIGEPWAQKLFDAAPSIQAVLPGCGLLQVSRPDRFFLRRSIPYIVRDRVVVVCVGYLPEHFNRPGEAPLADPLLILEGDQQPDRPLPPFFTFAGDKDVIMDDTLRLQSALLHLDTECETRIYPKQGHAFHANIFSKVARQCWQHQHDFLRRHLTQPES